MRIELLNVNDHCLEILKILLRDESLGADLDPKNIARRTDGFSGSDLKRRFRPLKHGSRVLMARFADLCVSAALDAVKEHVVVPWSKPPPENLVEGTIVSDTKVSQSAQTPSTASNTAEDDVVPPPAVAPRILYLRHFTKALKEITPSSSSEGSGTLADLKKWNEEFGEGRSNKKRQQVWGKGLFGFTEKASKSEDGRVVSVDSVQP